MDGHNSLYPVGSAVFTGCETDEVNMQSRDPESGNPGRFAKPEIPGLNRAQSRDFGIIYFVLLFGRPMLSGRCPVCL